MIVTNYTQNSYLEKVMNWINWLIFCVNELIKKCINFEKQIIDI